MILIFCHGIMNDIDDTHIWKEERYFLELRFEKEARTRMSDISTCSDLTEPYRWTCIHLLEYLMDTRIRTRGCSPGLPLLIIAQICPTFEHILIHTYWVEEQTLHNFRFQDRTVPYNKFTFNSTHNLVAWGSDVHCSISGRGELSWAVAILFEAREPGTPIPTSFSVFLLDKI